MLQSPEPRALQLRAAEPVLCNASSRCRQKPTPCNLRADPLQQRGPSTAKNKLKHEEDTSSVSLPQETEESTAQIISEAGSALTPKPDRTGRGVLPPRKREVPTSPDRAHCPAGAGAHAPRSTSPSSVQGPKPVASAAATAVEATRLPSQRASRPRLTAAPRRPPSVSFRPFCPLRPPPPLRLHLLRGSTASP